MIDFPGFMCGPSVTQLLAAHTWLSCCHRQSGANSAAAGAGRVTLRLLVDMAWSYARSDRDPHRKALHPQALARLGRDWLDIEEQVYQGSRPRSPYAHDPHIWARLLVALCVFTRCATPHELLNALQMALVENADVVHMQRQQGGRKVMGEGALCARCGQEQMLWGLQHAQVRSHAPTSLYAVPCVACRAPGGLLPAT